MYQLAEPEGCNAAYCGGDLTPPCHRDKILQNGVYVGMLRNDFLVSVPRSNFIIYANTKSVKDLNLFAEWYTHKILNFVHKK